MNQFYVKRRDKTVGPYTAAQLKGFASSGKVLESDLISRDKIKWITARDVKGLPLNSNVKPVVAAKPRVSIDSNSNNYLCTKCKNVLRQPRKAGLRINRLICPSCDVPSGLCPFCKARIAHGGKMDECAACGVSWAKASEYSNEFARESRNESDEPPRKSFTMYLLELAKSGLPWGAGVGLISAVQNLALSRPFNAVVAFFAGLFLAGPIIGIFPRASGGLVFGGVLLWCVPALEEFGNVATDIAVFGPAAVLFIVDIVAHFRWCSKTWDEQDSNSRGLRMIKTLAFWIPALFLIAIVLSLVSLILLKRLD